MDKKVSRLLSKHPDLQHRKDTGKVRCLLSGHEMPCTLDAIKSYIGGKKYARLKAHKDFDFKRLEPLIVPSQKRSKQLFCALTGCYVNRKPHEVKSHMEGRKYCTALEKYTAGELELQKERLKPSKAKVEQSSEVEGESLKDEAEDTGGDSDLVPPPPSPSPPLVVVAEEDWSDSNAGMELNTDEVQQPSRKRKQSSRVIKLKKAKVSNGKLKKTKRHI